MDKSKVHSEPSNRNRSPEPRKVDALSSGEKETLYLASIPGVRESILEGMATPSEDLMDMEDLEW